jgi:hypothetical protein
MKSCMKCDQPKRPGRGQKLCEDHHRESVEARRTRDPGMKCRKCGGDREQKGKQYCDDCRELALWERRRRKAARASRRRLPCSDCGNEKEAGHRRRYCDACTKKRAMKHKICNNCRERPIRQKHAKYCAVCASTVSIEKRRARQREYQRNLRERMKTDKKLKRRYKKTRLKYQRKNRERYNENQRMKYRLGMMQKGEQPQRVQQTPTTLRSRYRMYPVEPLLPILRVACKAALDRLDEGAYSLSMKGEVPGAEALAREVGSSQKQIKGMLNGSITEIREDTADRIATGLGLALDVIWIDEEERAA